MALAMVPPEKNGAKAQWLIYPASILGVDKSLEQA